MPIDHSAHVFKRAQRGLFAGTTLSSLARLGLGSFFFCCSSLRMRKRQEFLRAERRASTMSSAHWEGCCVRVRRLVDGRAV